MDDGRRMIAEFARVARDLAEQVRVGRRRLAAPMYDVRRWRLAAPMYDFRCTMYDLDYSALCAGWWRLAAPMYDVSFSMDD